MSVPCFRVKHLLLTHLLHRGVQLISIIHCCCPKLDYTEISDMENIPCNIYLIPSEVLYDQFRVRNTPIEELGLPVQYIASARDFCCADIFLQGPSTARNSVECVCGSFYCFLFVLNFWGML